MKAIKPAERPVQEVTDTETRGQVIMDGEKGGLIVRAAAMLLDKAPLSHAFADVDSHIPVVQHASPGRLLIGFLAFRAVRNRYLQFKYASTDFDPVDDMEFVFEEGEPAPPEHISGEIPLHPRG